MEVSGFCMEIQVSLECINCNPLGLTSTIGTVQKNRSGSCFQKAISYHCVSDILRTIKEQINIQ